VGGDVGNAGKIEFGQQAVLLGSVLKPRRDQPLRDHRRGGAECIQHVERRRVEGRGARLLAQVRARLEYGHRHAGPRQLRRGDEPDRTGARDQHAIVFVHALPVVAASQVNRFSGCRLW
jgi:hypothetical protein